MSSKETASQVSLSSDGNGKTIRRVTWVGLGVNVVLASLKCGAGVFGNSQALVADAVHSLSDTTTDLAILIGVHYWTKPADACHPHGHRRIEIVVALGIGLALAAVATGILRNAVETLHTGSATPPEWIAFVAAVVSVVAKEVLYRWTVAVGRRIKSMSLIANAWHHRSDALSSVPVSVAVAGAAIDPGWSFLDGVGAVAVSLFIYQAAFKIVRPAFQTLIDSGAPEEDVQRIRAIAAATRNVQSVHAVRTRYVSGSGLAIDLHVLVDPNMSVRQGHTIAGAVEKRLVAEGPDVLDVVVHIEPSDVPERDD